MPKPAKPQIASANDLLEGHVLYLSGDAVWTPDRHSAFVSTDADELGPTIRTDLGRQADHTIQDGQARNV